MYRKEKIIDGVFHFKSTPNGEYRPMSAKSMTSEIERLRLIIQKHGGSF